MDFNFKKRKWNENIEGELEEDGFFTTPNGSFWDPDYVYFNREGYDIHGGYYDENDRYIPGDFWDEKNQCYYGETEGSLSNDIEDLIITNDSHDKKLEEKEEEEDNKDENVINNSFEDFHMFCNEHTSNKIIGLCIDKNCKKNKLMCSDCIFKYHVKHDMIGIKDVIQKYDNLTHKIVYMKYKLSPMIIGKKKK